MFASLLFNGNSFYHSHIETRTKKKVLKKIYSTLIVLHSIFFFFCRSFCLRFSSTSNIYLLPVFAPLPIRSYTEWLRGWTFGLKSKQCWNFEFIFRFRNGIEVTVWTEYFSVANIAILHFILQAKQVYSFYCHFL